MNCRTAKCCQYLQPLGHSIAIRKYVLSKPSSIFFKQLKSFWDYDDKVTAPLHGFAGAQDYYDRCSSRQFLKTVKVPTRIIHSTDDPFMFKETVPGREELSRFIDFILTTRGGHVGFISGKTPASSYSWSENRIIEFLKNTTVRE